MRAGRQQAGAPLPAPADLRELVAARVRTLPEPVRAALLAASATPHPTTTVLDVDAALAAASCRSRDRARRRRWSNYVRAPAVCLSDLRIRADCVTTRAAPAPGGARRGGGRTNAPAISRSPVRLRTRTLHGLSNAAPRVLDIVAHGSSPQSCSSMHGPLLHLIDLTSKRDVASRQRSTMRMPVIESERAHSWKSFSRRSPDASARAEGLCLLGQIRYNDESFAESLRLFEQARQLCEQRTVDRQHRTRSGVRLVARLGFRAHRGSRRARAGAHADARR